MTTREQRVAEAVEREMADWNRVINSARRAAICKNITAAVLAALAEPEEVPEGWERVRIAYHAFLGTRGVEREATMCMVGWRSGSAATPTAYCIIEAVVPVPGAVVQGKVVQG